MVFEDVVEEVEHDNGGGINRFFQADVNHLGQTIHKDEDGVMSGGGAGELGDEVEGYGGPGAIRDG